MHVPRIGVDGGELYYEQHGDGTPLLLVHGTGADASMWGPAAELFASGARVIAFDRRGHSRSSAPASSSYRLHAEDAAVLLRALDAAPAVVLGWSAGGIVALEPALDQPALVGGLVLVEVPLHAKRSFNPALVAMVMKVQLLRRLRRDDAAAQTFLHWAYRTRRGEDGFANLPPEVRRANGANARGILADLGAGTGEEVTRERLGQLTVPVSCLVGSETPERMTAYTRRIPEHVPQATLETIDGAGHAMFLERPEQFAQVVLAAVEHAAGATTSS
jgi:pimeloyl-ACP methyl ester carboxylesterase